MSRFAGPSRANREGGASLRDSAATMRPMPEPPGTDPQAKLDFVNQWFATGVPHNRELGLRAVSIHATGITSELPYADRLVGNPETGFLHGGVITTVLDATCGVSVLIALRKPQRIATLDLRIDYLKPSAPKRNVWCKADCYQITRHVAFVRGVAHHGDEADPIASAAGTFMIFDSSLRGKKDTA